jgi:hypothetical protein
MAYSWGGGEKKPAGPSAIDSMKAARNPAPKPAAKPVPKMTAKPKPKK